MNPSPSDVLYNPLLTRISIAYSQRNQDKYIADDVFPNIDVDLPGGVYRTYDRADWYRSEAQERAPATPSAGGGFRQSTDNFTTKVYAIHKDVDDQTAASQGPDNQMSLREQAANYCMEQLLLKKEKLFLSNYFAASIWTSTLTGVSSGPTGPQVLQWDQSAANPIADIQTAKTTIATLTGYMPNTLVLGPAVYNALIENPAILDRIKYTQRGVITEDLLASMFGVQNLYVPWVVENTAAEGLTASYSLLYGKAAMLLYVAPNPGLMQPSAGYTFNWSGYLRGPNQDGIATASWYENAIRSTRVETEMAFAQKVVAADLGLWFASLVA